MVCRSVSRRTNIRPEPLVRQIPGRGACVIISVTSSVCFETNWVPSSKLCTWAHCSVCSSGVPAPAVRRELVELGELQTALDVCK
jgi:hypothetical protein